MKSPHNPKKSGPKTILFIVKGDDEEICGVFQGPFGATVVDGELAVAAAVEEAKGADPECWDYEDVSDILAAKGYAAVEWEVLYE